MGQFSRFLIAATNSGSGKTTLTLGILRALKRKGLSVQSFKCGPDYIDTKYHNKATNACAVNLDLFLSSSEHVKTLFSKYSIDKDVAVVEGVMGLFDGFDKKQGSSAEIAELLNLPIILIVNAKSMAYSSAALLYGFKHFCRGLNVVGVIFNFVGSENHYRFLKEACVDVGVECLGYLPKNTAIEVPSRHLGLNLDFDSEMDNFLENLADLVEKQIDLDRLLVLTKGEKQRADNDCFPVSTTDFSIQNSSIPLKLKIAVASDDAFNFTYYENMQALQRWGSVLPFSPMNDAELPKADLVYLPGGYPELYLKELSENHSMLRSIKEYVEGGGKLLAECGGFMYLSTSIADSSAKEYPMANVFQQRATMENMKLKLGYRQFEYQGLLLKGHEFHYSSIENHCESEVQQYDARGQKVDTKLLRYKNAIAGYTHLYWGEMKNIMDLFK